MKLLPACAAVAALLLVPSPLPGATIDITSGVANVEEAADWGTVLNKALADAPEGALVRIPGGRRYVVKSTVELKKGVTIHLERGAVIAGEGIDALFSVKGHGRFILEGGDGRPMLENDESKAGIVVEVMDVPEGGEASLFIRGLHLKGKACISALDPGKKYQEATGSFLGELKIEDAHLEASDRGVVYHRGRLRSLRVLDSLFTGTANRGLWVSCPITEGAYVRGNRFLDMGTDAIRLGGGKAFMVDDGALDHISAATIHENQILGGGQRAKEETSYACGILVYGNNVSIQGNIVRDFNRGEPVPGERVGHHFKLNDGTWHRGPWLTPEGKPRRRLAGAAIYAKARHGVISNNICTNSGWRAVIEVKTGGRHPYFLVANNIVDGRSLAIDDSFGFEPNVAKALWVNNVVFNMPYMAFKVSNRMQSAYVNNVIHDSKIGFQLADAPSEAPEIVSNNHFFNVESPVVGLSGKHYTLAVSPPMPIRVESEAALPAVDEEQRGRLAMICSEEGDKVAVAKRIGDQYGWAVLNEGSDYIHVSGGGAGPNWKIAGPNLVRNPGLEIRAVSGRNAGLPEEWNFSCSNDNVEASACINTVEETGRGKVLKIGGAELPRFNWILQQRLALEAGRSYRVRAMVHRSDPKNSVSLILEAGEAKKSVAAKSAGEWEELVLHLTTPEGVELPSRVRVHSGQSGEGREVRIESVSVEEIVPEERIASHG